MPEITRSKILATTLALTASASWLGCAPRESVATQTPSDAAHGVTSPPSSATASDAKASTDAARPNTARPVEAAQVDCRVTDGAGKTLIEGTSFFDDHADEVELDHSDASTMRRLQIRRLPDAKEGGLVLDVRYSEKRKTDDTTIDLRPMVRVAEKGRSELAIKLPSGEERRFAIAAR